MDQPPLTSEAPSPATPPPAQSLTGRLLNVLADPGEVFAEVKGAPVRTANWLVPALLFTAACWASIAIIFSQDVFRHQLSDVAEKSVEKGIEQKHLPDDQAQNIRDATRKYAPLGGIIFGVAGSAVMAFAGPFFWGLILWVAGAKILKGNFSYMKGVEVAGLVAMIAVLDVILRTLLVFGMGNFMVGLNGTLLVKDFDGQNPWHVLLKDIDLMTFWMLGLRSLGLARISSVSFSRAAAWVCGAWVAYTGLGVGYVALAQMLHKH